MHVRLTCMFGLGSEKRIKKEKERHVSFKIDVHHSKMNHSKMCWGMDNGSLLNMHVGVVC